MNYLLILNRLRSFYYQNQTLYCVFNATFTLNHVLCAANMCNRRKSHAGVVILPERRRFWKTMFSILFYLALVYLKKKRKKNSSQSGAHLKERDQWADSFTRTHDEWLVADPLSLWAASSAMTLYKPLIATGVVVWCQLFLLCSGFAVQLLDSWALSFPRDHFPAFPMTSWLSPSLNIACDCLHKSDVLQVVKRKNTPGWGSCLFFPLTFIKFRSMWLISTSIQPFNFSFYW